jgi:hypothetical protein
MTTTNTKRIAELNDLCRKAPGIAVKMFLTQGIAALPDADRSARSAASAVMRRGKGPKNDINTKSYALHRIE